MEKKSDVQVDPEPQKSKSYKTKDKEPAVKKQLIQEKAGSEKEWVDFRESDSQSEDGLNDVLKATSKKEEEAIYIEQKLKALEKVNHKIETNFKNQGLNQLKESSKHSAHQLEQKEIVEPQVLPHIQSAIPQQIIYQPSPYLLTYVNNS